MDPHVAIIVHRGQLQTVGMQVHIACRIGQLEPVELLVTVRPPEQKITATASARSNSQRSVIEPRQLPADSLDSTSGLGANLLVRLHVEQQSDRFVDSSQWVGRLVQSACCQVLVVRADGQSTDTPVTDTLGVVGQQDLTTLELPLELPVSNRPFPDIAALVARIHRLPVRMQERAVDIQLVTAEGPNQFAVGGVPQLDQPVVASRSERLTVGRNREVANPALVGHDGSDGLGLFGHCVPEDQLVVAAGGDHRAAVVQENDVSHPTVVRLPFDFLARRDLPPLQGVVLAAGEHILPVGRKAAGNQRAAMLPLVSNVDFLGICLGGGHIEDVLVGKELSLAKQGRDPGTGLAPAISPWPVNPASGSPRSIR